MRRQTPIKGTTKTRPTANKARDGAPPEKDITTGPPIDVLPGGTALPPVVPMESKGAGGAVEGEWKDVRSSNIKRVRWERALSVEFHSGKVYTYIAVPYEVWDAMMKAPSHGGFLTTAVIHKYGVRKI